MAKKPRPPASIGAKLPTLGEKFGRLEDRIQKIGGQPLPRLKNPKTNLRTAVYTIEERTSFDKLLKDTELVDTFRNLNPELIKYSYWTYKFQARLKNAGWRIDYFLVDKKLLKKQRFLNI